MTRALSTLIAGASDTVVTDAIQKNALPTVRNLFLTATTGSGEHALYDTLADLADPGLAGTMESLIDQLFEEATVKDLVRAAVAKLAAAAVLLGEFGIIEGQQKVAAAFEKSARADVDRLVKSPLLKAAALAVAKKAALASANQVVTLFIAQDADEANIDIDLKKVPAFAGAQLPYVGAPEAGRFGLIINGLAVEVDVNEGDTPVLVASRLLTEFEGLTGSTKPPVSLAINEEGALTGSFEFEYTDPLSGDPALSRFSIQSEGARLTLVPRVYRDDQDMVAATFYMLHRDEDNPSEFLPGIKGFRYGIYTSVNLLTKYGPHAVVADLTQAKSVSVSNATDTATTGVSESFFFQVLDPTGLLPTSGTLSYQVNNHLTRVVAIPSGSTALEVSKLFAQDLAVTAATHRVIGAVRPSSRLSLNSTPASSPSVALVAFGIEIDQIGRAHV